MNTIFFMQRGIEIQEVVYPSLYKYLMKIQILVSTLKRKARTKRMKLKRKDSK